MYSNNPKEVYISLEIESVGNKCRTNKFKTGSKGHVLVQSSDLGQCYRHQIENKTATIRLISGSKSPVQIGNVTTVMPEGEKHWGCKK